MPQKIARIISIIFHPVLIPTLGLLLLLHSGFYFSMLSWEAKRFILMVVFFTTAVLPMLSVAILALNPRFDISMDQKKDRILPFLSASVFYYLGFLIMNKINAFPVFKIFMIASVLVIIVLMLISFKWEISSHMAAIGSIAGALFALSFRTGVNPVWAILLVVVVSGMVGTARLILDRHSLLQVVAGYFTGFSIMYAVIYFV
jgi:membrane-associated phospholipid phosphatase